MINLNSLMDINSRLRYMIVDYAQDNNNVSDVTDAIVYNIIVDIDDAATIAGCTEKSNALYIILVKRESCSLVFYFIFLGSNRMFAKAINLRSKKRKWLYSRYRWKKKIKSFFWAPTTISFRI